MLSGIRDTYATQHYERLNYEVEIYGGSSMVIKVPCYEINQLLLSYEYLHINYMSIDVEGAELKIIESIDFNRIKIDILQIEDNYNNKEVLNTILFAKGYYLFGIIIRDLIYVLEEIYPHYAKEGIKYWRHQAKT